MLRKYIILFFLMLSAIYLFAEDVSNARAEQVESTIVITYDLSKASNIRLLMSTDMSSHFVELQKVSGAVGKNVAAGSNQVITWYPLKEYDSFVADNVRFKVEAYSQEKQVFTVKGISFTMIVVQGGTFTMGATAEQDAEAFDDEKPIHKVTLSDYMIGETEVTQELWQAVMGTNPSRFSGINLPVEQVSWEDCQTFISKLNMMTGKNFRLPTEAEWEYAARGGNKSINYKYAGSNSIDEVAWYYNNSNTKPHPVKQKQANILGIYDMSGNVREWCQDRYNSSYYSNSPQTNPTGLPTGNTRVFRGGGWNSNARSCRVSNRSYSMPTEINYRLGLRLVL